MPKYGSNALITFFKTVFAGNLGVSCVCNFADDNTPDFCDIDLVSLLANLENDVLSAVIWFKENYMQLNSTKCHVLFMGSTPEYHWVKVGRKSDMGKPTNRKNCYEL